MPVPAGSLGPAQAFSTQWTVARTAPQAGGVNRPSTAVQPPSTITVEPVT